jgi:hypothetical protein
MSAHNANLVSTALEAQSGVLQLIAGTNAGRQYAMVQVLEDSKKVHFWVGLVPDETYDPAEPLLTRPATVALPLFPHDWTPSQLAHAQDLIRNYGLELEKQNISLQLNKAPIGPIYVYATTDVKMNFITG